MAVEAAGRIPARHDVDFISRITEQGRSRPLLRRLVTWTRDRSTYPPWCMRRNAIARIVANEEQAPQHRTAPSLTFTQRDSRLHGMALSESRHKFSAMNLWRPAISGSF